MREHTDCAQEGSILDPRLQPGSSHDFEAAHATPSEPHPPYSQMEGEEIETHHDAFLDGSEMIHAAFAAQAIELAERERADALQSRSQADVHSIEHSGVDFHQFGYEHSEDMISQGDDLSIAQEMGSRPQKRRKITNLSGRKGKTRCLTGIQEDESALECYLQNNDDSPVTCTTSCKARRKRRSPVDVASRKQNHISAEQKRRAAIKTGYQALYQVIPALRDADLKEGKGRGGSGPGGGGVRAVKPEGEPMTDGDVKRRISHSPISLSLEDGAISHAVSPDRNCDKPHANKNYHHAQQYDEHGKPLRPGVRSVFPLVRQPGSEVIDGRQGPRSESVVLQQTINYLRQEQTFRLQLLTRLASLRQLAKRTFPDHEYDRLALCCRHVEMDQSGSTRPRTTETHQSQSLATLSDDTVMEDGIEAEQDPLDRTTRTLATRSQQPSDPTPPSDGRDAAVAARSDHNIDTTTISTSQGDPDRPEDPAYSAAFGVALSSDNQHSNRTVRDAEEVRERTIQKNPGHATADQHAEFVMLAEEQPFKELQIQNRASLVDWEDEWDSGAFVEGEDLE